MSRHRSSCEDPLRPEEAALMEAFGVGVIGWRALSALGVVIALVGIFIDESISIEFPGIILGALGYYRVLQSGDRAGQMPMSSLSGPPQ